jgi:DNA-binding response OmpR family regulator
MKNILIIDDDPRIVSALKIRLNAGGYATTTAPDAVTGLSRAVSTRPDLILLDISLPGGDGLSLAQRLKSLPETRRIPIIFVTAHHDPVLRERTMGLGAAGLFEKPYDAAELLAVIGHALGETGMFHKPIACFDTEWSLREAAGPVPAPEPPLKKILIIEDDARIAMALALRLKTAGYETAVAYDALTGVTAALRERPDLLLLDVTLPAGNGFTVAERVHSMSATPVPIIFLTASNEPSYRERARALGAAGFFEKPYEHSDLLAAVHAELGG